MMKKKRQQGQRINWWILIVVILLALLLILSRGQRAARRAAPPSGLPPAGRMVDPPARDTLKPTLAMNQEQDFDVSADQLMGRVDPAHDSRMVPVDPALANRSGMYMHRQAYEAFLQMHEAAAKDGIILTIISAMRTFGHQRRIWNGKWNGNTVLYGSILATDIADPVERAREILRFSAMPGTSRHHWGTDIDLNSLQNQYFRSGQGKAEYEWLRENAARFGYFQPYTSHGQGRSGGYEEEKWHWSYHPVASRYLEAYPHLVSYDDITGFDGWETARQIDVITHYVLDVAGME
jgi:zinc D-Ala-D-Ala carboxypeptidase